MIIDSSLVLSSAQACFATGDTVVSTNSIDLGVASPASNIGQGHPLFVMAKVDTAVTGGTSIQAVLQDSADDSTFATILSGPTVLVAAAIAGKTLLAAAIPEACRRYLQVAYVNVGANAAGKADAFIVEKLPTEVGA